MSRARHIELMHVGVDRVICAWERDGVIIDPGPESCIERLLEGLGGREPEAVLLTHIHLDHAGATGALVERFPGLPVYVHRIGAPHVVDPARLMASAGRLYGEHMDRLWGSVLGVPRENVIELEGGEEVHGLEVIYTPGHAFHHVTYVDHESGDAFVGDMCGVRMPPGDLTLLPTPPPEIDLELWAESLERIAAAEPQRLCLTHFGPVEDVAGQFEAVRERIAWAARNSEGGDPEAFARALSALFEDQPGEIAERQRQAAPPDQLWAGLERYWRKHREAGGPE